MTDGHARVGVLVAATLVSLVAGVAVAMTLRPAPKESPRSAIRKAQVRAHFDHSPVISGPFETPQAVTEKCLSCHPAAATQMMANRHFTWLGKPAPVPGHGDQSIAVGKKNVINNFCIYAPGNNRSCNKCHAGYGWADDTFDFKDPKNIDCLACHERSGLYVKGDFGLPVKGTDLVGAARSVGTPARENCLTCHAFGGGGQGVKHGDLDSSLNHPLDDEDVHVGRQGFTCVDCHGGEGHQMRGRSFSVSVEDSNGVACTDCHVAQRHRDERIDTHLSAVACQTCHIPNFASHLPTKAFWDWSKAGNPDRAEDPHTYLKIKGEFTYEQDAVPEYHWFNGTVDRYLVGDALDPEKVTRLNPPRGTVADPKARIWPFKVHRARQPYDLEHRTLLTPVTAGKGGFWTEFDWDKAFQLGSKISGLSYSGKYGFTETEMHWPLSHMVVPKEKALGCTECHGERGRLDWAALGYTGDPAKVGGRR